MKALAFYKRGIAHAHRENAQFVVTVGLCGTLLASDDLAAIIGS